MNPKFVYAVVAIVAAITIGAFLSEKGFRITRTETGSGAELSGGRNPGDQRIRDQGTGANGAAKARSGRQRAGAKSPGTAMGGGRATSGAVTERFGDKSGAQMASVEGTKPVPVLRNGAPAGALEGKRLMDELGEVAVSFRRNVRQGWAVPEALRLVGIDAASKATFVDRAGKSTTVEWVKLTNASPFYILTYNQGGQLMLLAGEKAEESASTDKQARRGRRSAQKSSGAGPAVSVHDIVRIEVS